MTGEELRLLRVRLGMNQRELADALGLAGDPSHICAMENGRATISRTIAKLAKLIELHYDDEDSE